MGCCEATKVERKGVVSLEDYNSGRDFALDRRGALKGLLGAGGIIAVSSGSPKAFAQTPTKLTLAFCGQLLCVVPYEVTRARGHFADLGFDVEQIGRAHV